jgi:uncharacterized protein (TIGR00730 family)
MRHSTTMIRTLLLFCGSRAGHDPAHAELAAGLGRLCAERSVTLVYGGGRVGLMGVAARSCKDAGGRVIGIIPRLLMTTEIAQDGLDELHVVETLHERKALMHRMCDAIIALPGSIGTLDEFFESLTWRELGIHDKPIWLLGSKAYWDPLAALLAHISAAGFGPPHLATLAEPLADLAALSQMLGQPARGNR